MAFAIVGMMAFMLYRDPTDKLIQGAMIAAFATAIGYYLGGSKTGADTAARNAEIVQNAANPSSTPQPVVVANDSTNPVPVKDGE